ncbi:DNA-binding protein [Planctomycetales bacterium]|nr:DNA-binding protein [Planctomycetales bacterium]GHS99404.1 DNA-binding protein [Planctomycetales bacterium]GHT06170.1 DNA-binding protein [Planctomycetales bacterium]
MTVISPANEIVLYQPGGAVSLEVRLESETVWLTQAQMTELFQTTKQNVSLHINHIFKEGELNRDAVVKELLTTAADGKSYQVDYYNLDVIISVGYRVKSKQGTQFRQWASRVLKEYLLKGYAVNQRFERLEQRVAATENKIDFFVKTALPPVEGIFYDGQIFDAYVFAADLIKSAQKSLVLIDNYIDESVLLLFAKRAAGVAATICTAKISAQLQKDLDKHHEQYPPVELRLFKKSHDRFLIIDHAVYHLGASLKDLGKRWFAFAKMEWSADDLLQRLA